MILLRTDLRDAGHWNSRIVMMRMILWRTMEIQNIVMLKVKVSHCLVAIGAIRC